MPLIAFASPKGGVGKSTLAAHVAAGLVQRGHKVLAIDFDPQNALRLHLGQAMADEAGWLCQIDRHPDWRTLVRRTASGVDLLPFGASEPRRAMELAALLINEPELLAGPVRTMLEQPGLVVVVDTPPGPSPALEAVIPMADLICMVLLADAGSAALIPQVASGQVFGRGTLAARLATRTVVVVNQVDLDQPLGDAVMNCAVRILGPRLLGAVCNDPALAEALAEKHLLSEDEADAGTDLALLTDRIAARLRQGAAPGRLAALSEGGLR